MIKTGENMKTQKYKLLIVTIFLLLFIINDGLFAQFSYKWMSVGSLHNWFSEVGCEIEAGRVPTAAQQDGLQWPAMYPYQDNQAAKGFWMGCTDFTDETLTTYPYKVVHVGPRVTGEGEFYPTRFEMISQFEPPLVIVDGVISFEKSVESDEVDPNLPCDRMIINEVNTQIGVTMTRKIMQFSHASHDNYMIYEYVFKNTGNTDGDAEIELPGQTLEGLYFFYQYRNACTFETRYLIGNGSGWGMNTMMDARGDGLENPVLYNDPPEENFRAQFAWHGYWPQKLVEYDNIGAPIFRRDSPGYISSVDTVGRIGAPQFVGVVTIHADVSGSDKSDDIGQPSTTGYYGSDLPETSNNDPYNTKMMESEYEWISRGHMTPRHAFKVHPRGDFASQKADPGLGTPGGFSTGNGYGPYTLAPGDSVRIVMAEAVAGLSRERCIEIGKDYKNGLINDYTKNQHVLSGRDSLFKTFGLAIDNYNLDYRLTNPPKPPKKFIIEGGGDRISLSWELYENDPNITGFRIYRSAGEYNHPLIFPDLIYAAGPNERSFDDTTPVRGVAYYYYIQIVANDPVEGEVVSNRYYSQAYDPAFLKRSEGTDKSQIRVVPNPYIISSAENRLRFPGRGAESDKLAFFNIPGQCTIQIYTELGELIYTIEHTDGSGDDYWNAVTSSNQLVVSGIYIAVITNTENGEREILKFVIIR